MTGSERAKSKKLSCSQTRMRWGSTLGNSLTAKSLCFWISLTFDPSAVLHKIPTWLSKGYYYMGLQTFYRTVVSEHSSSLCLQMKLRLCHTKRTRAINNIQKHYRLLWTEIIWDGLMEMEKCAVVWWVQTSIMDIMSSGLSIFLNSVPTSLD